MSADLGVNEYLQFIGLLAVITALEVFYAHAIERVYVVAVANAIIIALILTLGGMV